MIFNQTIRWLFVFLACAYPFGQFLQIPLNFFGSPEIRLYLIDILILLIFLSWIGLHLLEKKKFFLPPPTKHFFLFLGALLVSFLINLPQFRIQESIVGFLYLLRYSIYSSLYFIIYDLLKNKFFINKKFIQNCFLGWGLILSVLGMFQYLVFPDIRPLYFLGWDLHYYRVVGPFLDPNYMGIILTLSVIYFFQESKFFPLILSIIPLYLTYSRSSYLAFLTGLSTILFLRKRKRMIFIIILIFIISLILLPRPGGEGVKLERVASFIQRIENWETAINIWKNYPIFGVGFNNYRYAQRKLGFLSQSDWKITHAGAGVDNSFLFILVTSGITGEILFLNFWERVLAASNSSLLVGSLVAVFVHSLFINSLFYPWVMIWVWFLLGLSIKEHKKH